MPVYYDADEYPRVDDEIWCKKCCGVGCPHCTWTGVGHPEGPHHEEFERQERNRHDHEGS